MLFAADLFVKMSGVIDEKDVNTNEDRSMKLVSPEVEADTSIKHTTSVQETNIETDKNRVENDIVEHSTDVASSESISNASLLQSSSESSTDGKQIKVKSRELKSLLDAAKESNLDTNIVHKRESRKSETYGVTTNVSKRRNSTSSSDSYHSNDKRNMRSQNPEFVQKHRKFLKTVTGQHNYDESEADSSDYEEKDSEDGGKASKERARRSRTPSSSKERSGRSKTPSRPTNNSKSDTPKTPKRKRDSTGDDVGGASVDEKKNKKLPSLEGLTMKVN